MVITVKATKKLSFNLPYTGKTFQQLAGTIIGRDGYISGGAAADDGSHITLEPAKLVQRGIIAETEAVLSGDGLAVPAAVEPWFVLASIPDDHPDSGVLLSATADLGEAAKGVVIAFKANGRWYNPLGVNIAAATERSAEQGLEAFNEVQTTVDFGTLTVTGLNALKAQLVDAFGRRRTLLPTDPSTNVAVASSLSTLRPHATRYRTDFVLLRQPEEHSPEIVLAMGPTEATTPSPVTLATPAAPAKRAGYYARRGGDDDQQWWAWGDAGALKVKVGAAGVAATLLTGSSNINETWVVGQRSSDDAVIIMYVDGLLLRLVSIDAATGAQVDAPVTIANTGGQITHARAVLDRNERMHFTFENDEVTQQVYYGTCSIDSGSFGTAGISPRVVAGSTTGTNDTWPSIGVDRKGNVTIAYIQGSGTDEFGELVVATINASGELVSLVELDPATDVAIEPRSFQSYFALPASGFVPTQFDNFRRTAVVVTPYDEVYVLTIGLQTGETNPTNVLIYNEEFKERHGVGLLDAFLNIVQDINAPFTALAATSGELGEIIFAVKHVIPTNDSSYYLVTLNPRSFDSGRDDVIAYMGFDLVREVETSGFTDLLLSRGPQGGVQLNYVLGGDVETVDLGTAQSLTVALHPKDILFGGIVVPPGNSAAPSAEDFGFEVFNTRPKRMNFPFLVGNKGDFQGYHSLLEACFRASKINGEVVVRNGHHVISDSFVLLCRLRGESRSVILFNNGNIFAGYNSSGLAYTASGRVIQGSSSFWAPVYPGCVVDADPDGIGGTDDRHHVVRNIGFDSGSSKYLVLVADAANSLPGSGNADLFWGGISIEDLTFGAIAGSPVMELRNCYKPVLRNVTLMGDLGMKINVTKCIQPLLDGIDLRDLYNGNAASLSFEDTEYAVCRDVRLTNGQGKIEVKTGNIRPLFINCGNDDDSAADPAFDLESDTLMLSCTGRRTGSAHASTVLNAPVVIDNRYGSDDRTLIELTGKTDQYAPLVKMRGVWGDELGHQMRIDSVGELDAAGDLFVEDFHELRQNIWSVSKSGNALIKTPNDGRWHPRVLSSSDFETPTPGGVAFTTPDTGYGTWLFSSLTDSGEACRVVASLKHLKPGEKIRQIDWAIYVDNGATAVLDLVVVRQPLGNDPGNAFTDETLQTDTVTKSSGNHIEQIFYDIEIEAGYAYFLVAIADGTGTPLFGVGGAVVYHSTGEEHRTHTVHLEVVDTSAVSRAEIMSVQSLGLWTDIPLVRMRIKLGDVNDTALVHQFGVYAMGTSALAAGFLLDPGGSTVFGASNELRFLLRNNAYTYSSALTGFIPSPNTYYWYWVGYKSVSEAWWGISDDLESSFLASGSLAVGSGTVFDTDLGFQALVYNSGPSMGAPDALLVVDAIRYRSSTRFNT